MKNIYLSELAGKPLTEYLQAQGLKLHFINGAGSPLYEGVATHADIYMCQMGLWENSQLFMGNIHELGSNYPGNIVYNAVCTGKYFIHNLKYTHPQLLTAAEKRYEHKINVSQGYTRCCCLPVDDSSFITSDEGIAKALASHDAEVLLIEKGHIKLPGFDYGFIGGCAGHILTADANHPDKSSRTVVFNGNLAAHPDYENIAAFIKDRDIDFVYFKNYPLEDIGSILAD